MQGQSLWHKKRYAGACIALMLLLSMLAACGNGAPQTFTVGIMHPTPIDNVTVKGFKAGMTALGYREGDNVTYIYDGPTRGAKALERTARRLAEAKVDLIYTPSTPATQAAKRATAGTDIAVVFGPVNNPLKAEVVTSLRHPGGRVTGVKLSSTHGRRLQWLSDMVPQAKRIYIPHNPDDASPVSAIDSMAQAASHLGVEFILGKVRTQDELTAALARIPEAVDAIFLVPDSLVNTHIQTLVETARQRRLPISGPSFTQVESGALMSYGFVHFEVGKQAARLADQVLKGVKPADLPVETAEFFLTLNLRMAKALDLDLSDDILSQAKFILR